MSSPSRPTEVRTLASDAEHPETEVRHTLTDRPVEDMTKPALVAEWSEAAEALISRAVPTDERERYWDRRVDLWQEMKARVDAEAPECPECGAQSWGQNAGDPKQCGGCCIELGRRHEDLIERIDQFWDKVRSVPEGEDAV